MAMLLLALAFTFLLASAFFLSTLLPSFTRMNRKSTVKATVKKLGTYTLEEVSKHNTRTDCWIIIKDKVYDVTSYVEEHPGGDAILNHAGDDSTKGFYGPQHASRVFDMVDEFYIGGLVVQERRS
eukprot:c22817_g1_i1 orf=305-679(+)